MPLAASIAFGVLSIALVIAGIPLARGAVPRNPGYGARTGETLSDDDIWYTANRRVGLELIALGAGLAIWTTATLWWQPLRDPMLNVLLTTGILAVCAFALAIRGVLSGIRAKRARMGGRY